MSDSNEMNVDVPAVLGAISQLGALSTALADLAAAMQDGSQLDWTGTDESGRTLNEQLAPAEQGGVLAVTNTTGTIDGLIDSLGTTAGVWNKTEGTNVELNG
jgi:hypothetical protein